MDLMKKLLVIFGLLIASLVSQGDEVEKNEFALSIDRKERTVQRDIRNDEFPRWWIKRGEDLYEMTFQLSPNFLEEFEAEKKRGEKIETLQDYLRNYGVEFTEKSSLNFDDETLQLKVIADSVNLDLLEALFDTGGALTGWIPKDISARVEIYELPQRQIDVLLESADLEGEHTPERNAVRQFVLNGGGKIVVSQQLRARPGAMGKTSDAIDVSFPLEAYLDKEAVEKEVILDTREVGTILRIEPNIGETHTIELRLELEHHTAPPELRPVTERTKAPAFHAKKIQTSVILESGNYLLVGTWRPTGKPEYEERELGHVVFLTASIQNVGGFGLKQPMEAE